MKKAFSMLITLAFLIVMSIVGMMILEFSSSTTVHTTRSFLDTKAELMLRSATEYAILALHGHGDGCINNVEISDNLFDANVTYHYFLTDCNTSVCRCSKITTEDTNGSVLIYVTVTSKNPSFHIRKVRFTLQNP